MTCARKSIASFADFISVFRTDASEFSAYRATFTSVGMIIGQMWISAAFSADTRFIGRHEYSSKRINGF